MPNVRELGEWFVANNYHVSTSSRKGNIKLQKLLYYSKAMYYSVYGEQLFPEEIEAWENGPVVKESYVDYRYNGMSSKIKEDFPLITPEVERILKVVNHIYGYQTTDSLIDLTHNENPWKELEYLVEQRLNPIIKEEVISDYYKDLKDIFNIIDDEELEYTTFINVNCNVFSYDRRELKLNEKIKSQLVEVSLHSKDGMYTIYLDDNEELVIY